MTTRILVVDDSALSLRMTCELLSKAGYEVRLAHNGIEALMQIDLLRPQLIILDVMMPEMDGYEVCRRLRHKADTARVPVMMLTAQDTPEDKRLGFEAGADDYIVKPFQPLELLARVKALMDTPTVEQAKEQAPTPLAATTEKATR